MRWSYPDERYYDQWYAAPPERELSDGEIKARLVDRLRANPATSDETIRVDVKRGVVILTGTVASTLAKRAAGDDAWDTPSVTDVSNQLLVDGAGDIDLRDDARKMIVGDVMTPRPLSVDGRLPVRDAAGTMREADVGAVLVTIDGRLEGLLTDRDIAVRVVADGMDPDEVKVAEVCTPHVHTVNVTDPAGHAARMMRTAAVRRLPVVDGEGRVVGIVSLGDLALALERDTALAEISAADPNN